jgi:hypothetical protein
MKLLTQLLAIALVVIGLLMVVGPSSILIFWVSTGGLHGIFSEFNFISVVGNIFIIMVGIFLIRHGLAARKKRR